MTGSWDLLGLGGLAVGVERLDPALSRPLGRLRSRFPCRAPTTRAVALGVAAKAIAVDFLSNCVLKTGLAAGGRNGLAGLPKKNRNRVDPQVPGSTYR